MDEFLLDGISIVDGIPVFHSPRLQKKKVIPSGMFGFFLSADLIDGATFRLTPDGKALFELMYIHQDIPNVNEILKQKLLKNPVVNLMGQVFYGRGKQSVE